jgi:predicted NAD/FAD-dependent oxidoreductase
LPALAFLHSAGADIHLQERITSIRTHASDIELLSQYSAYRFDGVIVATHARGALALLRGLSPAFQAYSDALLHLAHERIATLTLVFDAPLTLPFPMMAGAGSVDWFFDRRQLLAPEHPGPGVLACVKSAIDQPDEARMVADALQMLNERFGPLPRVVSTRLIHEKLATLSARPDTHRPAMTTPHPRILLSGDYTHSYLPSTLEGAVRAGEAAAKRILDRG